MGSLDTSKQGVLYRRATLCPAVVKRGFVEAYRLGEAAIEKIVWCSTGVDL